MRPTAVVHLLLSALMYSAIFIASIAVILATETCQLLTGKPPDNVFLGFIFLATCGAYNLHWYWSPLERHENLRKKFLRYWPQAHLQLAIAGMAGSLALLTQLTRDLFLFVPAILLTILYTAPKSTYRIFHFLRNYSMGKTLYLASVWTYVTTAMPLLLSDQPWNPNSWLFMAGRFFLFYAICLLFDWRDREADVSQGIHSMASILSKEGMHLIFAASLSSYTLVLLLLAGKGWPVKDLVLLLTPAALCAFAYPWAISSRSEILFYGLIDGSLILPCILRIFLPF